MSDDNRTGSEGKTAQRRSLHELVSCFGGADELVFWSFRYFLGRMTIHTCVFADELAKAWPMLRQTTRELIAHDLEGAFKRDDEMRADPVVSPNYYPLGMDCDRERWMRVRACYQAANASRSATSDG